MMDQHHTIGRILVELELPSREQAFFMHEKVSTLCRDKLIPLLSALLDSWTDEHTLLRIDRLEIDLGQLSADLLDKEFPDLILSYLHSRYPSMKGKQVQEPGMEWHLLSRNHFDNWLHFLEKGLLPATAGVANRAAWENGVLEALATERTAMEECRQLLSRQESAVDRLLLQFNREFVHTWMGAYAGHSRQEETALAARLEIVFFNSDLRQMMAAQWGAIPPALPDVTTFRYRIDKYLVTRILLPAQTIAHDRMLEEILALFFDKQYFPVWLAALQNVQHVLPGNNDLLLKAVRLLAVRYPAPPAHIPATPQVTGNDKDVSNVKDYTEFVDEVKDTVKPVERRTADNDAPHDSRLQDIAATQQLPVTDSSIQQEIKSPDEPANEERRPVTETHSPEDEISAATEQDLSLPPEGTTAYINNAGLVLLHPYLPAFFEELGLLKGRSFRDEQARGKAVQLLGYLACGETDLPEYELVLPKVMCGLLPERPVNRFAVISEAELAEAQALLEAVIRNWNALGSTSPDGLRANFLLREGKLQWINEEWRLRVTQQSYDVLVNRLPWGFSVVKLRWMHWFLKTEWV